MEVKRLRNFELSEPRMHERNFSQNYQSYTRLFNTNVNQNDTTKYDNTSLRS